MNDIAKGNKSVTDWDNYITKKDSVFEADDILMYFTSNHDENSWNGTEYERMGDAAETFAALTYMVQGMPLIYNGQEYDFDRRLKFFEKDSITRHKKKMYAVYEKLATLKNDNTALNGGKDAAGYTRISTSDDTNIYAISREKDESKVLYIANLSDSDKTITLPVEGEFTNYMTGERITFEKDQAHDFKAWQYYILIE